MMPDTPLDEPLEAPVSPPIPVGRLGNDGRPLRPARVVKSVGTTFFPRLLLLLSPIGSEFALGRTSPLSTEDRESVLGSRPPLEMEFVLGSVLSKPCCTGEPPVALMRSDKSEKLIGVSYPDRSSLRSGEASTHWTASTTNARVERSCIV
ncbi:unnamed protein product [Phytophthora lilii]|uniref:Unnamed protein product n=1 Tax=Phytophthora lilii TaxID=2077276 RepID=A0A9W6X3I3_9STRA|nr:unnamed protein product [Phytophthora lilii]